MAACEDLMQAKMDDHIGENAECTSTKRGKKVHFWVQCSAARFAFEKQATARAHPQNDGIAAWCFHEAKNCVLGFILSSGGPRCGKQVSALFTLRAILNTPR